MYRPAPALTVQNAMLVLEQGLRAIAAGQKEIDLADLARVDSSAVSVLLAWERAGRAKGCQLLFLNVPHNLRGLVDLYGVSDLLPTSS
jgi:phospholipid transport system transporter-binding protein